jgi:MFS family permease
MEREPLPPTPPSLYLVMILQYAVGGAFLPFVTLFLKDQGLDYERLSWIHLTSAAVASTVPFFWGWAADRWVRLDLLIAFLHFAGGTALLFFASQSSFAGLLGTYALVFVFYPPTNALIAALAYHHLAAPERQFARLRLWGSVGWMLPLAPIFAWQVMRDSAVGLDLTFTVRLAAVLELLAGVSALALPRTQPSSRTAVRGAPGPSYRSALGALLRRPGFAVLLAVVFLLHSSFAALFHYSPPLLEASGCARKWVGPIQCIGVAVEVPFHLALPWVIRRFGHYGTIALGCATLVTRQIIYASPAPLWLLIASYVLAGACVAFYITAASISINALAERSVRATAQTLYALVGSGLGQMFGHEAFGWIASHSAWGLQGGFAFAAATGALGLLLLTLALRGRGHFEKPPPLAAVTGERPIVGRS